MITIVIKVIEVIVVDSADNYLKIFNQKLIKDLIEKKKQKKAVKTFIKTYREQKYTNTQTHRYAYTQM